MVIQTHKSKINKAMHKQEKKKHYTLHNILLKTKQHESQSKYGGEQVLRNGK